MSKKSQKVQPKHPLARRTLTVRKLMEMLEDLDGDLPVVISADYGDYCHTMQALSIDEVIECEVVESGYSGSGYAVPKDDAPSWDDDEDEEEDGEKEEPQMFVVLR